MSLLLASASPRRLELLGALGLEISVVPAGIDEERAAGSLPPGAAVVAVARAKAAAVGARDVLLLAADTIVVLDGEVLGKPASPPAARAMLARLCDRTHRVFTGVCVVGPDGERTAMIESEVRMRAYAPDEIAAYVAAGGGLDKAGAYGIQDEPFRPVAAIGGCWCNVMGLPLWTAFALLADAGLRARRTPAEAYARCSACPLAAERS